MCVKDDGQKEKQKGLTIFLVVTHFGCVVVFVTGGTVDLDCLVYTDSILDGRADPGALNEGLVDTNRLLELGTVVMVVVVAGRLDGSLGHADVVTETRLRSSTVSTLDMVGGAVGDKLERLRAFVVVVVVSVSVDLDTSIRVVGTRRSADSFSGQRSSSWHQLLFFGFLCPFGRFLGQTAKARRSTRDREARGNWVPTLQIVWSQISQPRFTQDKGSARVGRSRLDPVHVR